MKKDFDGWNSQKKSIESRPDFRDMFVKKGEVWMMNLGLNIGFEQDGSGNTFSRPGIIIKKFNRNMFWVVPLSTKQKEINFYYNFKDPFGRDVSAILAQIKLCSAKRLRRKMYKLDTRDLKNITLKLKQFL